MIVRHQKYLTDMNSKKGTKEKMEVGDILRLFVIVSGMFMVVRAILSLAKRKMTEPFCLAWVFLSVLMILSGALLNPSQMKRYVSTRTDSDYNNCVRCSVGIMVYQYAGFYPEKKKSGACHAGFFIKQ